MSSPSLPEPASLAIHLDLVGGLAGDMFVAALVDALPMLRERVQDELARVQPQGAALPAFHEGESGGLRVRRFGLVRDKRHAQTHDHAHGHDHAHDHGHDHHGGTPYVALREQLVAAPLSAPTRTHALAILALLAAAEARVHGIGVEHVHFHELADWDSLLDVVAAGAIAAALDGAQWSASELPLGGGTVRTAHGLLPVPAPATTELLAGYPWRDDGVGGERVTPTGAAILRHLVPASACGTRRGDGRLRAAGSGAGTRSLAQMPNIVRALVFDRVAPATSDAVTIIEFDIDDMSGEEIATAAERLRALPGVLDVSLGTRLGKKGRPVTDFRVLAQPAAADATGLACLVETSTLGLRVRDERRRILSRADVATTVDGARVEVKVAQRPDGERTAKAAHDDVAAKESLAQRRRVRAASERHALQGDDE
jgi:uncharacterized protein (TIGR00299 family) protein